MTEHRLLTLLGYLLLCAAGIFLLFRVLLPVLLPFLLGLLLARLAETAAGPLSRRLPRRAAAALCVTALLLLLGGLLFLLGRVAALELSRLAPKLPALLETLRGACASLRGRLLALADRAPDGLGAALRAAVESLFSGTSSLLRSAAESLVSLASGVFLHVPDCFLFLLTAVVSAYLFSAEGPSLLRLLRQRLPDGARRRLRLLGGQLRRAVGGWLRAEARLTGILFCLLTAGFFALRLDAPLLLGAAVALLDALPVFGAGTALVPWGVFCLLRGETAAGAGLLLLYGLCLAVRTGLEPRLVGRQIGLPPLFSLFFMYAGFRLFSLPGMILLPVLAILAQQLWVCGGTGKAPGDVV